MLTITRHAIERFQERVENVPESIVRARLSTRAFQCAERFGAKYVLLPGGYRAVIERGRIVTVLDRGHGVSCHLGDIMGIER
jgi:hypothetical protein